MKNIASGVYKSVEERDALHNKVVYVTILGKGDDADKDFKVECADKFKVTDVASGQMTEHRVSAFDFEHNSLIKLGLGANTETLQFMGQQHDLKFNFYYQGGYINTMIYDETQYKYKKHMAPPAKVDHSRSILSPMPGAVVSVSVEVGQIVVDG
jgi:acetyl/propionyl-CoA carboxylase alpha subunit